MELSLTDKQWKFCDNDNEIIAFLKSLYVCTDLVDEFRTIKAIKIDSDTKICRLLNNGGQTFGFSIYGYDYTTVDSKRAVILSFATYYGNDGRLIMFPDNNKINTIIRDTKAPKQEHDKQKHSLFLI